MQARLLRFAIALMWVATCLGSLESFADEEVCSDIPSQWNETRLGPRHIQHDSDFCYGYSLSHAISILTGRIVNPVDLSIRLMRLKAYGPELSSIQLRYGMELREFSRSLIQGALAGGVCLQPPSPEIESLIGQINENSSLTLFQSLLNLNSRQCDWRRETMAIPSIYEFGFSAPAPVEYSPDQALHNLDLVLSHGGVGVLITANLIFSPELSGLHSVAVVGRRRNLRSGMCEYLILDSMDSVYCESKISNAVEKNCATGEIWLTREAILRYGKSALGLLDHDSPPKLRLLLSTFASF